MTQRITTSHAGIVLADALEADRERLLDRLLPQSVPPAAPPPPPPPPRPRVVVRRPAAPRRAPAPAPAPAPRAPQRASRADDGLVSLDEALRLAGRKPLRGTTTTF